MLDTNAAINILDLIDPNGNWQITKDTVFTVFYVRDIILSVEYQSCINRDLLRFDFLKERFKLYKRIVNTPKEAV